MEIALFGGSFDPPHLGHLLVVAHVLATEAVDEVWMVPVFEHPFRKKLREPFETRVRLCEAALQTIPLGRARVSRAESELGGEGRTVDLLEHLVQQHPQHKWALVLGTDLLADKAKWKRFDRIEELARTIVLRRGGFHVGSAPAGGAGSAGDGLEPKAEASIELPEVSSTQVRTLLAAGGDVRGLLPRGVAELIARERLYRAPAE
jgi:nicotinate-nucleotide adenylyltransferase